MSAHGSPKTCSSMDGKKAKPAGTIAILDVGHGNCTVVSGRQAVIVVDTGPRAALLQYLVEQGIEKIDAVYISHADKDHIGGLVQLLASGVVALSAIYLNTDSLKDSDVWNDLLYELDHRDAVGEFRFETSLNRDHTAEYDNGQLRIEVVGPSKYLAGRGPGSTDSNGNPITSNSISAVIRIVHFGKPIVLLAGDTDEVGLDDIEAHGCDIHALVLVFPHHGGLAGFGDLAETAKHLWNMVRPQTVIFSIARGRLQHPRPELIRQVREEWKGCRIACTQLTTHCAAQVPPTEPTHLNPEFASGRGERHCCAGTFVIDLETVDSLLPSFDDHQKFITDNAPTALCRAPANGDHSVTLSSRPLAVRQKIGR